MKNKAKFRLACLVPFGISISLFIVKTTIARNLSDLKMWKVIIFVSLFVLSTMKMAEGDVFDCTNTADGRATVVIVAPKIRGYYSYFWEDIVKFQVDYVKAVMATQDNVLYVVSSKAINKPFQGSKTIRNSLPSDIILVGNIDDIWIRDFSPVKMSKQVMFRYAPTYLVNKRTGENDGPYIQNTLKRFLRRFGVDAASTGDSMQQPSYSTSDLVLDGGNVVDNEAEKAILTSRVVSDNAPKPRSQIIDQLKSDLSYQEIAIIKEEGDATGHSDGMVSFLDTNVLAINHQGSNTKNNRAIAEISDQFSGTPLQFVVLDSLYREEYYRGFDSACGLHINTLATDNYLYVPVFGPDPANLGQSMERDDRVLSVIREATRKQVIAVSVPHDVCRMGGSVRCLSWQVKGPIADALVTAAMDNGCGLS